MGTEFWLKVISSYYTSYCTIATTKHSWKDYCISEGFVDIKPTPTLFGVITHSLRASEKDNAMDSGQMMIAIQISK